jgi:hypothetical protein
MNKIYLINKLIKIIIKSYNNLKIFNIRIRKNKKIKKIKIKIIILKDLNLSKNIIK